MTTAKMPTRPPVISIVGSSGVGKTTLMEKLIPELVERGFRVGTVKHDVHGFEMGVMHAGKYFSPNSISSDLFVLMHIDSGCKKTSYATFKFSYWQYFQYQYWCRANGKIWLK